MSVRWVLGVTAALAGATAHAQDPARADFGYGQRLTAEGVGAVYALPLPIEVYRHTAFADLRDLRVLNGRGEAVPYALSAPETARAAPRRAALPLFPLHGDPATAVDALRLKVTAAGASVEIQNPQAPPGAAPPSGYLLDSHADDSGIVALELGWDAAAGDFSARLRVEASDDLKYWRNVVTDAPVVSLHYAGEQFTRSRVEIADTQSKFLRLEWQGRGAVITGVTAERRTAQPDAPRTRTRVAAKAVAGKPGEYEYDLGGHFPVDRLSLALPEENSLARVAFDARESPGVEWRPQTAGTVYRLRVEGAPDLESAPLSVATCRCRFWRLRIVSAASGLGSAAPALIAGWSQDRLEFLARGDSPFELVYGNSAVTASAATVGGLLAPVAGGTLASARLGARVARAEAPFEIGGPGRLDRSNTPDFKRAAVLWAALVVAVALLGRMAWQLVKTGSPTPPR